MREIWEVSFNLINSRLIHFIIILMAGKFVIQETNYNAYLDPEVCPSRFKHWVRFLNKQCIASHALTASADLQIQPLYDFCSTALNSTLLEEYRLIGDIRLGDVNGRNSILITSDNVNRVLGFPRGNFAEVPEEQELVQFFQTIEYQGDINLPKMSKGHLKPEWEIFFDTLAKVFSYRSSELPQHLQHPSGFWTLHCL